MKTLKESILSDMETTLSVDLGSSIPKILELLNDPISAHYGAYSANNYKNGFEHNKSNVININLGANAYYEKFSAEFSNGTATDIYNKYGQPGWEKFVKLAKKNLKEVDLRYIGRRNVRYGDFLYICYPSKQNDSYTVPVLSIEFIRKNMDIGPSKYLEIQLMLNKNNQVSVFYHANDNFNTQKNAFWERHLYDISSNLTWYGIIEALHEKLGRYWYCDRPEYDTIVQKYAKNVDESIFDESILSNIDKTLEQGDKDIKLVNTLSYHYMLSGVGGVGDREEKMFGPNITDYESLPYISKKYANTNYANEFPKYPNYKSFAKWLERLQAKDIGLDNFKNISLDDAEKIEALAKKEGLIKNVKNIKVGLNKFPNMLIIYVHKVDGAGNVKKTKLQGRNELMYVFNPL